MASDTKKNKGVSKKEKHKQRTGFTESGVVQSVVGQSLRLVMTQWVRHLATFLLKSSNDK
jgi:hypothetical protein